MEHIILEGDYTTVITWIQEALRSFPMHSLLRDITILLQGCSISIIRHVYRKANSAMDLVASFIAHHIGKVLWTSLGDAPEAMRNLVLSDFFWLYSF